MFVVDDMAALLLAEQAAAAMAAGAAGAGAAGAGAGGLATAAGLGAPAALAAEAAPAAVGAMETASALTPELAGKSLSEATGMGSMSSAGAQMPEAQLSGEPDWGSMGSALDAQHAEASPGAPTDWRGHLKTAQKVLGLAGNLVGNKKDKQTIALMEMGAGMGAANDATSTLDAISQPISKIAGETVQNDRRLSQALPSPRVVSQSAPPQRSSAAMPNAMPATRMTSGSPGLELSMQERLRLLRGY